MARFTGREAIDVARTTGRTLSKYADPTEDARKGLSADEAEAIAAEDPSLVYLDMTEGTTMATKPTHEQVVALVRASCIDDGTGTLYTVCEQALRAGEGTPERVREIWAEATAAWKREREVQS